ncbi:MAG: LamG domain-containing protein [Candidatus Aenigmarchaeota archaeon]|nr:LamG domain-containing protein [Candidatus Aenigmarchaeota archaeon]
MPKGASELISFVLVTLIVFVGIGVVLGIGLPVLDEARETGIIGEAGQNMEIIDNLVRQVAAEGTGTLRVAQINVNDGVYRVDSDSNSFSFELPIKTGALAKGTFNREGNLITTITGIASASQNSTHLKLENELMEVVFLKVGTEGSFASINTSTLVKTVRSKTEPQTTIVPTNFGITLNGTSDTSWGTGYTKLAFEGGGLTSTGVLAHVRSSQGAEYEVLYTLRASSDFLLVDVRNTTRNQTTLTYGYRIGPNSTGDVIRIAGNETSFTYSGGSIPGGSVNYTSIIDNTNYTRNSSTSVFQIGGASSVLYNASDGSLRDVRELLGIGQGSWNYTSNSTHTTVNYTLAGSDGFEFGLRDSRPGGSYWMDENGSLYGVVNISNDFIRVGMTERNMTVYNSSNKIIFNASFDDAIKVDGQNLISLYGSGTQNKTVYFYDWNQQGWILWKKGSEKIVATGGNITYAEGYTIHTFTSNGTFNVTSGNGTVEYLVIAGGGGGGGWVGGGGGAGGYREGELSVSAQLYNITVGSGGAGGNLDVGGNGTNSIFSTVMATGGGAGGALTTNASTGGSGGGGAELLGGAAGTSGQGNIGGSSSAADVGGGGGGAGGAGGNNSGTTGGAGGAGLSSRINGSTVTRAGGGGGGATVAAGTGGSGGGGAGSIGNAVATAGTANTGSGGGGARASAGSPANAGGAGGSGIVIIRYKAAGVPDWLDPRNKQEFKWRYAFNPNMNMTKPGVNVSFLMTAHDPFVRVFVDSKGGTKFKDDFSANSSWSGTSGKMTITNGTLNMNNNQSGDDNWVTYDLQRVLGSGNYADNNIGWVMRFKVVLNNYINDASGQAVMARFGLTDSTSLSGENPSATADSIHFAVAAHAAGSTSNMYAFTWTNTNEYATGISRAEPLTATRWVELVYTASDPKVDVKIYTDEYSNLEETATTSLSSKSYFSDLRYLFGKFFYQAVSNDNMVRIDDVQFWDGTTIPGGPGNISIPFSLPENRTSVTTAEPGLVGYWNFNEGFGTNVTDSSGLRNPGYLSGGVTRVSNSSCKFSSCLSFDGSDDIVFLPDNNNLNLGTSDFTAEVWVNPRAMVSGSFFVGERNPGGGNAQWYMRLLGTDGTIDFVTENVGYLEIQSNSKIPVRSWSHVVGVREGGNMRLYINGTLDKTASGSVYDVSSSKDAVIGDTVFNGYIDEARIYRRALNHSEILQLYHTGINQQKPGIYFTKNNATDNEEVLFATTNVRNVFRTLSNTTQSGFNIFSNHTDFFGFNYTFNSTMNQNFMFSLGTMGRMNTTNFNPQNNATQFSSELIESVANSTLTWYDLPGIIATGGNVTYADGYKIHTFTSNGTFNVTSGSGNVEYLVIAGGGGGGGKYGGGGGAGGYLAGTGHRVTSRSYPIVIGAGGGGGVDSVNEGLNGTNSSFDTIESKGGGGGDTSGGPGIGSHGGSGGGSACALSPVAGTPGQGNSGGTGYSACGGNYPHGGGGGAGAVGQTAPSNTVGGNGGSGLASSINGTLVYRAGGGGGGTWTGGTSGSGGSGGGGNAGAGGGNNNGADGTANTGGGGGGASFASGAGGVGGTGGSGIVIIRYPASWNSTNPLSGVTQHDSSLLFNYDGGASGIWRLDEGSGLNATDSSGNGNTGTVNATWISNSSCKFGSCMSFDGGFNNVNLSSSSIFDISGDLTIEAWVNPNQIPTAGQGLKAIFTKNTVADNCGYGLYTTTSTGVLRAWFYVVGSGWTNVDGVDALSLNTWYHVAVTHKGNKAQIYINGIQSGGGGTIGTICTGGSYSTKIGAQTPFNERSWNGTIDEVRLYPRALTDTEIREHYQREVTRYYDDFGTAASGKTYRYFGVEDSNTTLQPVTPAGTVLHYRFNDNSTLNVTDSSGLGNGGGVINGAIWMTNSSCKNNFGRCMFFDGTNDYVNNLNPSSLPLGNSPHTIAAWIYYRGSGDGPIVVYGSTNTNQSRWLYANYNGVSGLSAGFYSNDVSANYIIPNNVWTHVTWSYNTTTSFFYVNGTLVASPALSGANTQLNSQGVRIGSDTFGQSRYFNGSIDEVIITNRTLSPDEVYQLYLGGANRTVGGKWHRVASAEGVQSAAFNLTDHNNTFEGADYDMRMIFINGTSEGTVSTSTSPASACYTRQNTSYLYACSYDQSELSSTRSSGIVYSGDEGSFVSLCNDAAASEYRFNITSLGALRSVVPFSAASCAVVANQSEAVTRLGLPTRPFGSYLISGDGMLHMELQYGRIALNGTDKFGKGSHRICIEKTGRQGTVALVSVRGC